MRSASFNTSRHSSIMIASTSLKCFAVLVLLAAAAPLIHAALIGSRDPCKCGDHGPDQAGNCSIKIHECGCLHDVTKWRYEADAIDVGSGKSAHYEWTEGQDGAAEQAALSLFNTVLGADACNCNQATYAYGSCSLVISVCFTFNSTADLVAKAPSFKAYCTDSSHSRVGQVFQFNDPESAAAAAGEDLLAKFPDEPVLCNASASSFRALFRSNPAARSPF